MILVTGANGLVGSHILFELVSRNKPVKALIRSVEKKDEIKKIFSYYTDNYEQLISSVNWVNGDICDIDSLETAFNEVDEIYHTAAMVSFNPNRKHKIFRTNINGTKNIVDLALEKGIKKLAYISSVAALGSANNSEYIDENLSYKPSEKNSNYAFSKFNAELEIWRGIAEGLNVCIINPTIILGPGKWNDGSSSFFKAIYNGLRLYPSGVNGFVDVRDVAKIIILLMEKEIFAEKFIVNSINTSYKELFNHINKNFGRHTKLIALPENIAKIAWRLEKIRSLIMHKEPIITKETIASAYKVSLYSNAKIIQKLNYQFIPFEQTIKDICNYYLKDK
jgi:nucleoside-diphosphate-sugar epimerase